VIIKIKFVIGRPTKYFSNLSKDFWIIFIYIAVNSFLPFMSSMPEVISYRLVASFVFFIFILVSMKAEAIDSNTIDASTHTFL
jgi:hypothetical protein